MNHENPLEAFLKSVSDTRRENSNLETELETLAQKFRIELTALVDDPTHPMKESDFRRAFVVLSKLNEEIFASLTDEVPDVVARIVARHIVAFLNHFIEAEVHQ